MRTTSAVAGLKAYATAFIVSAALSPVLAQVSSSRLANNATDGGNWLMYSGSYRSERFSPLDQISAANVGRLRPLWVYQPPGIRIDRRDAGRPTASYVTSAPQSVALISERAPDLGMEPADRSQRAQPRIPA
jgi:glucose dehydrogenase